MQDFFDYLENMGMEIRRITPFQFELDTKFPIQFNSEINANDLYWNYIVSVEFGEYGCRCERYATNYNDAIEGLKSMPKGKITIISFYQKTVNELREKRKYKYFYN